eukprot:TRINITY_DN3308_c0_g1_i2.p1 TRINITY_DN3308_c0_g1~~TRINITY_DN3308_c0_g1_i2.p1  ORF type:complete len:183 (+),score=25.59 TRINITY_DN3308_c0_g1_i2:106-654(+)
MPYGAKVEGPSGNQGVGDAKSEAYERVDTKPKIPEAEGTTGNGWRSDNEAEEAKKSSARDLGPRTIFPLKARPPSNVFSFEPEKLMARDTGGGLMSLPRVVKAEAVKAEVVKAEEPKKFSLEELRLICKEELKGRRIMVRDGKWKGSKGTFRSWSGTVAYADLENEGRKALRLATCISILDT